MNVSFLQLSIFGLHELFIPTHCNMGLVATKPVFGGLRTTKAQTSLRIHAD